VIETTQLDPTADADAAPPVDADVPCFRCGYNVRGLPADGQCPECAAPIDESVRRHRLALANRPLPLEASDPRWVRRLAWAERLVVLGAIGVLAGEVLSQVVPSAPRVLLLVIFLVPYLAFAAGAWLGAAREPVFAARRRGRWLRVLVRTAVAGWALSLAAMMTSVLVLDWSGIYRWRVALVIAAAVLSWAFFWRQRELADRLDRPALRHACAWLAWLTLAACLSAFVPDADSIQMEPYSYEILTPDPILGNARLLALLPYSLANLPRLDVPVVVHTAVALVSLASLVTLARLSRALRRAAAESTSSAARDESDAAV
jgi:hypothetical protein